MTDVKKTPCPTCQGKKVIEGICETSSEWRGTQTGTQEETDDMKCTPDQVCPTCNGKGYEKQFSNVIVPTYTVTTDGWECFSLPLFHHNLPL